MWKSKHRSYSNTSGLKQTKIVVKQITRPQKILVHTARCGSHPSISAIGTTIYSSNEIQQKWPWELSRLVNAKGRSRNWFLYERSMRF